MVRPCRVELGGAAVDMGWCCAGRTAVRPEAYHAGGYTAGDGGAHLLRRHESPAVPAVSRSGYCGNVVILVDPSSFTKPCAYFSSLPIDRANLPQQSPALHYRRAGVSAPPPASSSAFLGSQRYRARDLPILVVFAFHRSVAAGRRPDPQERHPAVSDVAESDRGPCACRTAGTLPHQ